ncbi:hypothetical protein [Singulisphaera acidiphila]|uniref:DUF2946 domain-containing protein n=1 Tax=Singulisphaera acidiphila (strain ATCC BAA-1392 / DSM 18658 / VKM B-2454 / MOB10) TaxID=886293 RepID=L0DJ45_SINAD|nr:hypothetical protein [Singulisphaera acidiphila]AGA28696.1 hypothetical protein Sinac_4513 [Singulisphaera acidiphila DSM 18658]
MASRCGIRRTLVWSLIALYATIMVPGQGWHAFSACGHRIVEHAGSADSHADDRSAPGLAAPHDEGSCVLCTCLAQTQLPTPNQGPVLRSPVRKVHRDDAPVSVINRPHTDGDPRAPPQPFPV